MNAIVLRILDDPAQVPAWLERELVGPDLAALVAELEVIHGVTTPRVRRSLDQTLGGLLPDVLRDGLVTLPRPLLTALLRGPRLLLELQDMILQGGGKRWDDLARKTPRSPAEIEATWRGIGAKIGATNGQGRDVRSDIVPIRVKPRRMMIAGLTEMWAILATTAATILGVFYVLDRPFAMPAPAASGWNRPGTFARTTSSTAKLSRLANAAEEWKGKTTETRDELATRLGEIRLGCTRLILADHSDLSDSDASWLVERCRMWAGKVEDAIHALEKGEPADRVRTDANAIVNQLIKAVHDRAASKS